LQDIENVYLNCFLTVSWTAGLLPENLCTTCATLDQLSYFAAS